MSPAGWLLVAYVASAPLVLWALRDMARIPRRIWYWMAQYRVAWATGVLLGYLAGGIPGAIVALVWWRSAARAMLRDELAHLRSSARPRRRAV